MTYTKHIRAALLTGLITLLLAGHAYANPAQEGVPVSVTGELTILYRDDFKNKHAELQYFIEDKLNNTRYQLHFEGTPPGHLRSGAKVKVHGNAKGKEVYLSADGVDSSSDTVAPATMAVTGEQKTLVMVANFTDASVSCPVEGIRDLMFTDATDQSIDDLFQETSHGGVWLTGQVIGPYNINYSNSTCDYTAWGQAADDAARTSGVEPDSYDRKVYVLPPNGCPAAGIGTVGGNPSRAWVFHCDIADVFGHEFGHNLGMHHAATPSSEYGDNTDIMGIGQNRLRQINAPHKEQMGWLPSIKIETVNQSGYYDIAPLEFDAANALAPQALKIAKPDTNEYYYLSYRRGIGFDANLTSSLYLDRLSVHTYSGDGSATKTHLLALPADGESFADAANGITVMQLSHNNDYVTVEVSINGSEPTPTCTAAPPQLSLSPASQSGDPGTTRTYSVSLFNNDSTACGTSTFDLSSILPGWSGSVSPNTLTLLPGDSGTASLQVTSPTTTEAGSYTLQMQASDTQEPGHYASKDAIYVVNDTTPVSDTEAPTTPSGLAASANTRQVSLSWSTSSDNVAVTGYQVYRDGVMIADTLDIAYTDRDGIDGMTYAYSVTAYDAAGNISPRSAEVMASKAKAKAKGGGSKGKGRIK